MTEFHSACSLSSLTQPEKHVSTIIAKKLEITELPKTKEVNSITVFFKPSVPSIPKRTIPFWKMDSFTSSCIMVLVEITISSASKVDPDQMQMDINCQSKVGILRPMA